MKFIVSLFCIVLISCGEDNDVTDLGATSQDRDNTAQLGSTSKCNSPLKLENISCRGQNIRYIATFIYITGRTEEEKKLCIRKYALNAGVCGHRFIAPDLSKTNTPCTSTDLSSSCEQVKQVKTQWLSKMTNRGMTCGTVKKVDYSPLSISPNPPDTFEIDPDVVHCSDPLLQNQ